MSEETTEKSSKYAIVEHGGKQFRVEEGDLFTIDRVVGEEVGASIEFGKPLLVQDGSDIKIGAPIVEGSKVTATVLGHERGKKILIFKFKKRKKYRKRRGHRQELTRLRIDSIN
ncbi:MAG: 50S ribosomal protein L21 [Candidatus Lindowbacteria bacterium]|nr:50S ribosomal protein L21 [Candidatus Lindowbacteria bacterium]